MPEIQSYRPLLLSELSPAMNVTLVTDQAGIDKLAKFLEKVGADALPVLGLDTETNFVHDFWVRRVRTIQVGNKDEQYVIDLLAFAGTEERLVESQGFYGKNNGDIYKSIFDVLDPVLCSNKFLKVGVNLPYE